MKRTDLPDPTSDPAAEAEGLELDPRIKLLVEGSLSSEELQKLERDATQDALLAAALAAYRPLPDRMAVSIANQATADFHAPMEEPRRKRRVGRWIAAVSALAAVLLAMVLASQSGPGLPPYSDPVVLQSRTNVRGPAHVEEGASKRAYTFERGGTVHLQLAAESQPLVAPQALVYLDGWTVLDRVWTQPRLITEGGSIQLVGTVGEAPWDLPPGPHQLNVAVGPAWAIPPPWAPGRNWQRFTVEIDVP